MIASLVKKLVDHEERNTGATAGTLMHSRLLVVIVNYRITDLTIQCLRALSPEMGSVPGTRVPEVVHVVGWSIER